MEIHTYPEMNEKIKEFLRISKDDPMKGYVLARIEELEKENKKLNLKCSAYSEFEGDVCHAMHKVGWNNSRIETACEELEEKLRTID